MNLILAHGSPDPAHHAQVHDLAARTADVLGEAVQAAFLGDESVPQGARVLPVFVGGGAHVSEDCQVMADQSGATLLPPLGLQAARLAEIGVELGKDVFKARHPMLFGFYRFRNIEPLAAEVYARRKAFPKLSMGSLHGEPSCEALRRFWESEGVKHLAVQPMLLFAGRSLAQMQQATASDVLEVSFGQPLATHAAMPELLADCFRGQG